MGGSPSILVRLKMSDNQAENPRRVESTRISSSGVDATIAFTGSEATPRELGRFRLSKQCRDMAFAAALLRTGKFTVRHLARAVSTWTTHGNNFLSEHLVRCNGITPELRDELEKKTDREFQRIADEIKNQPDLSAEERDLIWLNRFDPSGRLGKLLGIADVSAFSCQEKQSRQVGARYTLLRKLGQGGLGTVWLARDENLRRYVAVKEITKATGSGATALAHFRREAEITGRLEHPSIVPIYQFGTDDETGRGFYAMRFMGKRTLQDAIVEYHERRESGNRDLMLQHRLLTAFVNICQAVAHAHSRNVIHRDLKPDNIALDGFGQVVLLDWGLSKIDDETGMYEVDGEPEPGDLHNRGATVAGRVLGTPLYMAPEQAAGRLDEVDQLTDVYGLGGILYAILTGVAPHEEAIELRNNRTPEDVFTTILARPVRPARELNPHAPAELSAICEKALAAKRYLRYPGASELAEDVNRFMAGTPVTAYVAPWTTRMSRWMSDHPTATQLFLLFLTLVVLGGAAIGYTARKGRQALQQARYKGLTEVAREVEANLQFDTQELTQDVRFVTDLPLMQAVLAARNPDTASVPPSGAISNLQEVSAEEWLERHGSLLDGLLKANPAYLVMSMCQVQDGTISELIRAERFAVDMQSQRVPVSQLLSSKTPESGATVMSAMRPGEVVLITADRLEKDVPHRNPSPLVLLAVSPIFNEQSGEFFGINIIELDLRKRLHELLVAVAPQDVAVFVTDAFGSIALSYEDGRLETNKLGTKVQSKFPTLAEMFDGAPTDELLVQRPAVLGDDFVYARRLTLGSGNSRAEIGIVCLLASPKNRHNK